VKVAITVVATASFARRIAPLPSLTQLVSRESEGVAHSCVPAFAGRVRVQAGVVTLTVRAAGGITG